jgi:fumarate reductase iron-sulfur subunit
MSEPTKTFVITRFDPDKDEVPKTQEYEIPVQPDWKILDAINFIKDEVDPTLSHRWSCRMAVCGSCGMMVNGEPKLTCKDAVSSYGDTVTIEPLANFPVVRDLVVELEGFMEKFKSVKPWVIRAKEQAGNKASTPPKSEKGTYVQSPAELAEFKQFSMCINCMLCYAACPVVANECSEVCPKNVDPAAAVNQAKFNAVIDWATALVLPRGGEK